MSKNLLRVFWVIILASFSILSDAQVPIHTRKIVSVSQKDAAMEMRMKEGLEFFDKQQYKSAAENFQMVVKNQPQNVKAHLLLATSLIKSDKNLGHISYWERRSTSLQIIL